MLTTGDLARLSNNTLRTVRFYEEAGILKPIQRKDGGHRLFPETELDKLRYVTELRAAGFSLEEIRDALDVKSRLGHAGTNESERDDARELVGLLDAQIDVVSERLARLGRLRDELKRTRALLCACSTCSESELIAGTCEQAQAMRNTKQLQNRLKGLRV